MLFQGGRRREGGRTHPTHTRRSLFLHTGHFHHRPSIYNTKMDGCSVSRFGLGGSSSLSVVSDPPTFDVLESPFISVTARRRDDVTRRWLHSCPPLHCQRKLAPALNSLKSYIHIFFFTRSTHIQKSAGACKLLHSARHRGTSAMSIFWIRLPPLHSLIPLPQTLAAIGRGGRTGSCGSWGWRWEEG